MSRPSKALAELDVLPPLPEYWRAINRAEREAQARVRAKRKAHDKRRAKCRCEAYKWPHRPGGGKCRYPDPPLIRWQDAQAAEIAERLAKYRAHFGEPSAAQVAEMTAWTTKPQRRYRYRYAGILRQIARKNGLHPIRDRAAIAALMPEVRRLAKDVHHKRPKYKYRNMEITDTGLRGNYQTAGPMM